MRISKPWLVLVCLLTIGSLATAVESSTIRYRTDRELIAMSERIVHARVLRQRAEQPDGANGPIFTVTTLAVLEDLTGVAGPELEVWELGGVLGNRFTYVGGAVHYSVGSEVLVLLENGRRGWRSVSMGFSKFDIIPAADGDTRLIRNMQGTLVVGAAAAVEQRTLGQFRELAAEVRGVRPIRNEAAYALEVTPEAGQPLGSDGIRWVQADSGIPVPWYLNTRAPSPLFSGTGVSETLTALSAWTSPPSASIVLNYAGTTSETNAKGPFNVGINRGVITFEDPNGEISGNTLAIGGGSGYVGCGGTFNGRTWNCFEVGYVIFQNAASLDDNFRQTTDFTRVLQHEIGHAIGLGHSDAGSSNIMYASCCSADTPTPPALGSDDLQVLNFIYPSATPSCSYSINPTSANVGAAGTSSNITVSATAGCSWTATSNNGFITVNSGSSGTGSGTVNFSVGTNTTTSSRTGTITVAGHTFTVTQSGAQACTYAITPATVSIGFAAATGNITLTTQSGCPWTATSDSGASLSFSPTSGTGGRNITFTVTANTSRFSRTVAGLVGGQWFYITQEGAPACTYSITPVSVRIGPAATAGNVHVTTGADCPWTSSTSSGFVAVSASSVGSGLAFFTVTANPGSLTRTGTATIAGQTFTVTQEGQPCTYTLSPSSLTTDYGPWAGTVSVTTAPGCPWTAKTTAGFMRIDFGGTGSGSGVFGYSVEANLTGLPRSGVITIADKQFVVSQAARPCTFALTPASVSIGPAAASGTIQLAAPIGCPWTATSESFFLDAGAAGGSGPAAIPFSVAANPTGLSRSGSLVIGGQRFTVTQAGAPCTASINPASVSIGHAEAMGTIALSIPAGCAWTNLPGTSGFITLTSARSGVGSATIGFRVDPNAAGTPRSGTATIAGRTFTVNQAAAPCTYDITPSSVSIGPAATDGTVFLTTPAGCPWSTTNTSGFVNITSARSGIGPASVAFAVDANTTALVRTGLVTIGGRAFSVTQSGVPCTYAIAPGTVGIGPAATDGSVRVTAPIGCAWAASPGSSGFINMPAARSGNGPGTVPFTVDANPAGTPRSGSATIAGITFTVNQAGLPCTYAITPGSVSIGQAAASGAVRITAPSGCPWTAASASPFVTLATASGSGAATVPFSVATNLGPARQGSALIAGRTFTVNQAAPCAATLTPPSVSIGNAGATGTIGVSIGAGCTWEASSQHSFLSFTNGTGRVGPGTVNFTLTTNGDASERVATATVAAQTFSATQSAAPLLRLAPDVSGDGKADLIWHNRATGELAAWRMDGGSRISSDPFSPGGVSNTNWHLVATADMDGDGQLDLIWQEQTQGWIGLWKMNGRTLVSSLAFSIERVPDTDWKIVAAQDFNGDGKADLVWHHRTQGWVAVWFMDGMTVLSSELVSPGRVADTNWRVEAVADFNADGRPDLVWRHQTEGWLAVWLMDGIHRIGGGELQPATVSDTNWRIAAVADIDRDNQPDLVWQDITNGWLAVWLMDGVVMTSSTAVNPERMADTNWRIVGPK